MNIYGVCISDAKGINETKAEYFLKTLLNSTAKDIAENYFESKKENSNYTVNDWCYDYESIGYGGLSAVLRDIIGEIEDVSIVCDDPDGIQYLGLGANAPWEMTDKTKTISKNEYEQILRKYVSQFVNEKLEIRWWNISEDYNW